MRKKEGGRRCRELHVGIWCGSFTTKKKKSRGTAENMKGISEHRCAKKHKKFRTKATQGQKERNLVGG